MPLGGAISLGLAGANGAFQVFKGLRQAKEARKLKQRDITPAAFTEELAASRLAANNQRMPGSGAITDNINRGAANGLNNAIQAGTGSAGILSTLGALNQNRNSAFLNLGQQAAAYQQQQQNRLSGNLRQQAAYQQQSRDEFNREKAALQEGSSRNIFGGVSTLAGAGITAATGGYAAERAFNKGVQSGAINPALTTQANITNETSFVGPMNRTVFGEWNGPQYPAQPSVEGIYDNGQEWSLPNPYNTTSPLMRGFGNTRSGRLFYGR